MDAGTWTRSFLPTDFLNNVFAAQSGNIWTSGYDGTVLHKAGASSTLQLVSAVSRKSHKTVGTFDINLPLIGTPGVECRDGGGSYSFVFSFATNVVSGTPVLAPGREPLGRQPFAA